MANVIGLIIGILVLMGGLFYLIKENEDMESRKIYLITTLIGAAIAIVCAIKMFIWDKKMELSYCVVGATVFLVEIEFRKKTGWKYKILLYNYRVNLYN